MKLIFYMYLYGYTTAEIAAALTELGKKTYLGNVCWTSNAVVQVLRNERHCGDVLTRKTFTPNYLTHKSKKNNGDRPQSIYRNHHEAIVSRDDFIAVQHLLDNAKYGNKSILPELRVIDSGFLKGFVTVNPRWAGFTPADYFQAAASIMPGEDAPTDNDGYIAEEPEIHITVEAGDFDMRGFEITRSEFFDTCQKPYVIFQDKKLKFSTTCVRKFGKNNSVEILVNPNRRQFAVRTAASESRNSIVFSKVNNGIYYPRDIPSAAFRKALFALFGWNEEFKYRVSGALYQKGKECVYLFNIADAEIFIKPAALTSRTCADNQQGAVKPLSFSGKRVRAVPKGWTSTFGNQYYLHQYQSPPVEVQNEDDWKIRMEGQLFETGEKIYVTGFDELKKYISQELSCSKTEEITK